MKKTTIILALALVTSLLAGCGLAGPGPRVTGSGHLETREMDLSGFTRVAAGSTFSVEIVQGESARTAITADDNLFDYIEATVTNGTLHLRLRSGRSYNRATLRAAITMPSLTGVELSGASRGQVNGFNSTEPLSIDLSGASDLKGDIRAGDTRAGLSGASSLTLTGAGANLSLEGSGASSADLTGYEVNNADVSLSGASHATVSPTGALNASLSGASHLYYTGSPTLGRMQTSGGSSVNAR